MPTYTAQHDPSCYPRTNILKNIPNLRDELALQEYELAFVTQRLEEGLPRGRLGEAHLRAIHRHLFQDVYVWAGKYHAMIESFGGNNAPLARQLTNLLD